MQASNKRKASETFSDRKGKHAKLNNSSSSLNKYVGQTTNSSSNTTTPPLVEDSEFATTSGSLRRSTGTLKRSSSSSIRRTSMSSSSTVTTLGNTAPSNAKTSVSTRPPSLLKASRTRACLLDQLQFGAFEPLLQRVQQTLPVSMATYSYRHRNKLRSSVGSFAEPSTLNTTTTTTARQTLRKSNNNFRPATAGLLSTAAQYSALPSPLNSTTIGTANSIRLVTARAAALAKSKMGAQQPISANMLNGIQAQVPSTSSKTNSTTTTTTTTTTTDDNNKVSTMIAAN